MANVIHLEILKSGVEQWNTWRREFPKSRPDLTGADLTALSMDFSRADFSNADLTKAKLSFVVLEKTILADARLNEARLYDASVCGADLRGADFSDAIVDGIKYDRKMKCLGARVDSCKGSARFRRAVLEADYIEAFAAESPVLSRLWGWTSDYSRSPFRIGIVGVLIICAFASIYYASPSLVHWPNTKWGDPRPMDLWFAPVYYSVVTFTTLGFGDIFPATTGGEILSTIEVLIGYVWLGYLVSVLALRASART